MNCRRVINLMSAYVDGELTGVEMLDIRAHLHDCAECRKEWESVRLIKQALTGLKTMTPRDEFAASILRQLDAVEVSGYQRVVNSVSSFVHRRLTPVAAALAASGVALVVLSAGGIDNVQQDTNPVMATAPLGSQIENTAYITEIPGSHIAMASSKPLVVAADAPEFHGAMYSYASLTSR